MSAVAIRAERLGKRYRLGQRQRYKSLRETVALTLQAAGRRARATLTGAGRSSPAQGEIWALRDVSFDVQRGEVVGVIGRNGAGKSTLLKVLSRITEPTEGEADLRGRVGSLLEVGTGFHPELTGRENVYLSGAILGMRKREIARKFDDIVAFAEVERFVDTTVKHYSSGMQMRLAFAVAAHMEPAILIVDEVLAVGDAAFQRRCLGKMGEVARGGRTVLFVSHNMAAISSLCQRALLLKEGRLVASGPVSEVVGLYTRTVGSTCSEVVWPDLAIAPGTEKARIVSVRILDMFGQPAVEVDLDSNVIVEIEYRTIVEGAELNVSISLYNDHDVHVFSSPSVSDVEWFGRPHPVGIFRSRGVIPGGLLNHGRYFVSVLLVERAYHAVAHLNRVLAFDLLDRGTRRGPYFGQWGGVVRPELVWKTQRLPLAN